MIHPLAYGSCRRIGAGTGSLHGQPSAERPSPIVRDERPPRDNAGLACDRSTGGSTVARQRHRHRVLLHSTRHHSHTAARRNRRGGTRKARVGPRLPASVRQCQTAFRRQNPRAQPWGGHQYGGRDGLQGHLRVDTKPAGNGDQIHCSDVRDCLRSAPAAPYDEVRDPASDSCPGQLDRAAKVPLNTTGTRFQGPRR